MTVAEWNTEFEIKSKGGDGTYPDPIMTFDSAGFDAAIVKECVKAGYTRPSPIQSQAWPVAAQGGDMIAVAKTGSGKTVGFLFPAFEHIKAKVGVAKWQQDAGQGPVALVLAPTRELAIQIQVGARPALPRSWANFSSSHPNSNQNFGMLNRQRELTLLRPTATPTASSAT